MKHTKRIFAIFMSLAMVMTMMIAMSATAFAVESYPITINNENATATHTYTAYQVFSGTLSTNEAGKKVLANIDWGTGVDGAALLTDLKKLDAYKDCKNAADVADVLEGFADNSTQIEEFTDIVGKHLATGIASTASADNKTYTINATAPGYYIVKETGINPETNRSASGFMINVVGPTTANVKDNPMTPDKNILQNGTTKVKEGTANVGDDVQFVVDQIEVPSTDGYKTFKFVMKDTLPKGLTYKSVDSVKIGTTTLTADQYEVKTTKDSTTGKTELRVVFKDALNLLKGHEGEVVEVKYTATVNKDAEFGNTGNKNEVVFEFTNNPDDEHTGDDFGTDEPHGTTPKSETTTYVTKITILKVDDAATPNPLANAVFDLSGTAKNVVVTTGTHFVEATDGTYYKLKDGTYTTTAPTDDTADKYESRTTKYKLEEYSRTELTGANNVDIVGTASGADGKIVYEGLKPGEYTITETGAPEGYNKIEDPIVVKIKFAEKKFSFDGTAPENVTCKDDGTFEVTIVNKAGSVLPSTGGIGTVIFYVLGSLLVVGCGIVLISKRRMLNK